MAVQDRKSAGKSAGKVTRVRKLGAEYRSQIESRSTVDSRDKSQERAGSVEDFLQLLRGELTKADAPDLEGLNLPEVASSVVGQIPSTTKSEWDELIGPFYSTSALVRRWGRSRQAVHKARINSRLLATPTGDGALLYPTFQFGDERSASLLPHLKKVMALLESINMNAWAMALWLNTERPELADLAPHVVMRGTDTQVQMVLDLAADDVRRKLAA